MNKFRWIIGLWLAVCWLPLFAQTLADIDTEHELTVTNAQQILAQPDLELHVLMSLRQQLAAVRDQAASRVQKGSLEAKTLEVKLASLGEAESSAPESPERAQRRNELMTALVEAREPIVNAKSTVQSTELLIRELDGRVRSYQAQHLLTRFPSPLSPQSWPITGQQLKDYTQQLYQEAQQDLAQYRQQRGVSGIDWLVLAVLFGIGIWLMTMGQRWLVHRFERVVMSSDNRRQRWVAAIFSNFAHVLLPLLGVGVWLLSLPLLHLQVPKLGSLGVLSQTLPMVAFIIIMAHWLGHTLFAPTLRRKRMLPFNDGAAKQGVLLCQGLGGVLALFMLFKSMMQEHEFSAATVAVVSLPLFIIISVLLWYLSHLFLYQRTPADSSEGSEEGGAQEESRLLTAMAYVMRASAIVAPLLVLVGLVNLARYAVVPLLLTLAQLGFALFLYHLVFAAIDAVGKAEKVDSNTPSLLPVMVVMILGCLLLPLLAITWGAQVTDITEVWYMLTNGIEIGEIRLSLDMIIVLAVVFSLGMLLTHWLQRLLRFTVLPRTRLDSGARNAVVTGVGYGGMMLAALIAVSSAGLNLASLAVVAGALSVGIGFGLQTIVSNFVSGIILLVERPVKEGDWIEVSGYSGIVQKISVRSTRIQTFDRHDVIVPNSALIAGTVKNMTLSSKRGRLVLPIGVAYGSDLEQVRSLLLAIGQNQPGLQKNPGPQVLLMGFGDNSLDLELRCILNNVGDISSIKSQLLFTIYQQFNEVGIEIPFPQQDIYIQGFERLIDRFPQSGDSNNRVQE